MTDDIRGALIRAVPPLTAPPDRIAQVRRRAARTRGRRTALSLIAAAAATGLAIATPALLSAAGSGRADSRTAGDRPANQPFPTGAAPTSGPAGPDGTDGVGTGRCPIELDLMSQTPAVVAGQDQRLPALPLRAVTLCRYRHVAFDLSAGTASRRAGPVQAPPGEFGAPVDTYVDQRIWRPPSTAPGTPSPGASPPSGGCLMPSPWKDVSVDIVHTVDARGIARQYLLMRITCANPDAPQPARQLEAAVDRLLGPP